jgi:hypothetical protein
MFMQICSVLLITFNVLQGTFLFAMVWSIGASSSSDGRKNFNILLREIISGPLKPTTKYVLPCK